MKHTHCPEFQDNKYASQGQLRQPYHQVNHLSKLKYTKQMVKIRKVCHQMKKYANIYMHFWRTILRPWMRAAESQKLRRRVRIAERKVFARPESFCAYLQNGP